MRVYNIVEDIKVRDFTFDIAWLNRPYLEDIVNKKYEELTNQNIGLHFYYDELKDKEVAQITMDLIAMKIIILYK
jgi:hypothetical protein